MRAGAGLATCLLIRCADIKLPIRREVKRDQQQGENNEPRYAELHRCKRSSERGASNWAHLCLPPMRQQAKFPLMRQRADHVTIYLFKCSACERIAAFLLDEEGKLREW